MKRSTRSNLVLTLFIVSVVIVLGLCIYTGIKMNYISEHTYQETEQRLLTVSRFAAELVTAGELNELQTPEDMEKPLFDELRQRLITFAENNDVLFVYYMRKTGDNMAQYILDNDLTEDAVDLTTEPFEWEDMAWKALSSHIAAAEMTKYLEGYEHLISAFAPVYDDNGKVVAVAGVDISDEEILVIHDTIVLFIPLLAFGVLSVLACGLLNVFLHNRSNKERLRALDHAIQASRAKSDFLSNMSHEIRTPMNAIIGMTSIARSAGDTARKDDCLDKIKDASAHLLSIINDILDMSKIESGKLELAPVNFSFEKMLQRIVVVNSFRFEEKQQAFHIDADSDIPDALEGDDQRIIQVVTNLLSNSAKFTPEHGEVRLSLALESLTGDDCVLRVCVKDSGIGISAEQQSRLFQSFEQAERGISRQFGGTGLGLAISKNIIKLMGGEIWIESELGKGAAFSFTAPLKLGRPDTQSEAPARAETPELDKTRFDGRCILLAEDIEINREIVLAMLESAHLQVDCAENGAEVLRLFRENPDKYDLIFMDIQMPEMDGCEATEKIRALDLPQGKTIPIVAMTANVFKEDIERYLSIGMNDHIGKPLNYDDILRQLRKYLS